MRYMTPRCDTVRLLSRAADRESFDPERRLADADGHALPVLATGSNTVVELQVVANHRDARQHVRTVADQGGALEGRADAAVLDGIRLARREHELAGGDIHLPAAEIDRVNAALYRADDLLRRMRTGPHVGVGHARQRHVRERLTPAVAGRLRAPQPGAPPVLHVAAQHAVLDQD